MTGVKAGGKYSEASMLALAQAATAGAMHLLISTPPNLIAKSTVEEVTAGATDVTFLDWILVGTPHALIGLVVSWFVVFRVIMPEAMPAVLVIILAGLLRIRGEPVLKWEEIAKGIDWNVIFLFGGGIALGMGLEASGFADWLASGGQSSLGCNPSEWADFAGL